MSSKRKIDQPDNNLAREPKRRRMDIDEMKIEKSSSDSEIENISLRLRSNHISNSMQIDDSSDKWNQFMKEINSLKKDNKNKDKKIDNLVKSNLHLESEIMKMKNDLLLLCSQFGEMQDLLRRRESLDVKCPPPSQNSTVNDIAAPTNSDPNFKNKWKSYIG